MISVKLIDSMGSDLSVVNSARISFAKHKVKFDPSDEKLVKYLAGAETYGQLLLGLSKPCADLSRGASDEEILGVAATVALQAIRYRELYPNQQ